MILNPLGQSGSLASFAPLAFGYLTVLAYALAASFAAGLATGRRPR